MMIRVLAITFALSALLQPVAALALPLETALSTTSPAVGVPFELVVTGRMPAAVTIEADNYADALSDWTWGVVTRETTIEQSLRVVRERIQLRADREGLYLVRPIVWSLRWPDGTTAVALAKRRFVEVPPGAAASLDLRPEHPLRSIRRTLAEWLPWIILSALLLATGLLVWLWRHRKRKVVEDPFEQLITDCAALVQQYRELDKASAFRLSEIARRYVEARTPMPALEWTGHELRRAAADWLAAHPSHRVWLDRLVREICALEDIKYRPPAEPEAALVGAVEQLQELARQAEALLAQEAERQREESP
ncbi:MAG: hypothetical protein D6761_00245 [Candidatus Dadabacteria bacterium]|nr:MAG: hypothetical protein D6761_00245 [Candidatus Dadabacteria bacterium]